MIKKTVLVVYIIGCMYFVCISHCCFASDDTIMMQRVTIYNWTQYALEIYIKKMIHYKFPKPYVSEARTLKETLSPMKSCHINSLFYTSGKSNPVITRFEYELQVFFEGQLALQQQVVFQKDYIYDVKCDK